MVIFRSEGKVGYHQAETLDEAARFVERLRNREGVEQARIFRLDEVEFELRPYYRVEIAGQASPDAAAAAAPAEPSEPAQSADELEPDAASDGELEAVGANGKRRFGAIGRL